ncbi:MAG: LPS-assembly protein LptD [Epsilonproteobacteria bacterium]|nr:MAG: LPS-assembly protein LptD [Campylobacterota bacterium]
MRKLLLWIGFVFSWLHAADTIEFYATVVESNTTHIHASGNVLVLYEDYYLSASEARYDRNSTILELFGNIIAMEGSNYFSMGDYARLNTQEKERFFSPFFMLEKNSKVWLSSLVASSQEDNFQIQEGMVSGCDPNDPLWQIYFSSMDFNSETKWTNIYNARLHLYDIPVFYFPYFGYSLDNKRRSGLMIPSFGISSTEGFYYQQPVYIAVHNSWDVELRPQIRTRRGAGMYGTLRFVDSNVSKGSLTSGYFDETSSYIDKYNLAHENHYGFDLKYENYAVLQRWFGLELSGQSGLYADVSWMNDIDYINLSNNDETQNATANQILSRINFFYNEDKNYYGTSLRYYLDLNKKSNADTLQTLPELQYHRYLESFFNDHLYYTANANVKNLYRPEGKRALQGEIDLPVTLQSMFFDDYINASYTAQLYGQYSTFSGEAPPSNIIAKNIYNTGSFGRLYHRLNAGTYLTRGYDDFGHTIALDAEYVIAGVDQRSGYYEDKKDVCARPGSEDNIECDFYNIEDVEEIMKVKFTQFLFDGSGSQRLYHRLTQNISFDSARDKLSELENELEYQINNAISLYTDIFYNYQKKSITKTINAMRYDDESINTGISHFYENKEIEDGLEYASYLTMDASYRYDKHYRYFGKYAYDVEHDIKKFAEIGFVYSKRCWDFGLRYVENNRPILTKDDANSVFDKYIYFTIMLKPIGGTDVNYKLSNLLDGS